jgi:hypothetical protein
MDYGTHIEQVNVIIELIATGLRPISKTPIRLGLGALIGGLKAARLAGGDLRYTRPGEQARLVLELTRLDRVLRPYPTVEDALAGY